MTSVESPEAVVQNLLINTKFKIDEKLLPSYRISAGKKAYVLGECISDQASFDEIFKNLIWISYKKNFAPLLIEKNKVAHLTSDAGWGCVIRCTQMLLANCLRKLQIPNILQLFDDDKRNEI